MKNSIMIIALLALMSNKAGAQSTLTVYNATDKTQQQIIDDYNNRTNVSIRFYPNPAVNYLVIEPQLQSQTAELKIMDIAGRVITMLHLEPGSNVTTVDLSNYMSGLYVLALYDDANRLVNINRFNKQ